MSRTRKTTTTTIEEEVPLQDVAEAEVERVDGVLGPANDHPFLLMRAEDTSDKQRDVQYLDSAVHDALETLSFARIGKTISSATAAKLKTAVSALEQLQLLLGDVSSPAELPEGVDADMTTQNKAGDAGKPEDVGTATASKVKTVARAEGDPEEEAKETPEEEQQEEQAGKQPTKRSVDERLDLIERGLVTALQILRAQEGKGPGSTNSGELQGGLKKTQDLLTPGKGEIKAIGGPDVRVPDPSVDIQDLTDELNTAAGEQKYSNITSEEELPGAVIRSSDIKAIARSFGETISKTLEDALKPVREDLEAIKKEDSRGQTRPFVRGAAPSRDYHLVERNGEPSIEAESEQLERALEALDPTARDVVTRQLAKNAHPLMRAQQ